jgi:hypothetical protein
LGWGAAFADDFAKHSTDGLVKLHSLIKEIKDCPLVNCSPLGDADGDGQ